MIQSRLNCDGKGGTKVNKLSDAQRETTGAQFVQAEAALHQAEQAVQHAATLRPRARARSPAFKPPKARPRRPRRRWLSAMVRPRKIWRLRAPTCHAQRARPGATMRGDPQQLQAAAAGAKAQADAAEAQLSQANARGWRQPAGARAEQIQAAEAQFAQARAAQRQIEVQLAKTTLTTPRAGWF